MSFWAVEWRSRNKLDGVERHLQWENELRLYRTRREARAFINLKYGYIRYRPDLHKEPHGWRMPRAVRVKVSHERREAVTKMTAKQFRAAVQKLRTATAKIKCYFCREGETDGMVPMMVHVHGRCVARASSNAAKAIDEMVEK